MKELRIFYVDFWKGFSMEDFLFTKILKKNYQVVLDDKDPEILFCSVFGNQYLNYQCPRILYVGEPYTPDFNLYDYAIGFDHIQFMDRYLRYPLYLLYNEKMKMALHKHECTKDEIFREKKFCNFVVSSGSGKGDIRAKIFDKLSQYKRVDSGGRYKNNLPDHQPVQDKYEFQKNYKFSLAMENSKVSGYTTEKIIEAWAAGTIPIYWGNPDIAKEFNSASFITITDNEEWLDKVKEIDQSDDLYEKMCKEPIYLPGQEPDLETLEKFLLTILSKNCEDRIVRGSAKSIFGRMYEYRMQQMARLNENWFVNFLRKYKRKMFGVKKIE